MPILNINGAEIEYFEQGKGEPIIFIHGSSLDASFYYETAALLEGDFRVITYNRRGYGRSSRYLGIETIDTHVEDLKGLFDCLGIKKAHLNGHSSGGAISIAFALKYPQMVQSVTLLEAMLWQTMPIAQEILKAFAGISEKYEREGAAAGVYFLWEIMCGVDVHQRMPKGGFERIIKNADTAFSEIGIFTQWKPSKRDISALKMPILAVIGGESLKIHRVYQDQHDFIKELIPHTVEYILPHATHLLFIENPHDFTEALKGFLKGTA